MLAGPCFGAEEKGAEKEAARDLKPGALKPGGTLEVRPARKLDTSKKEIFLRLDGPGTMEDIPLDTAKIERGRFRIVLPKEMRQGKYKVQIVDEVGTVLYDAGKELRILAHEKPVITKVLPHPSYPMDDVYSFELLGENLGQDADDDKVVVKINDEPIEFAKRVPNRDRRAKVEKCEDKWPCLIGNRNSLQILRPAHASRRVTTPRPT